MIVKKKKGFQTNMKLTRQLPYREEFDVVSGLVLDENNLFRSPKRPTVAMAGPTFQQRVASGPFQGMMAPQTP